MTQFSIDLDSAGEGFDVQARFQSIVEEKNAGIAEVRTLLGMEEIPLENEGLLDPDYETNRYEQIGCYIHIVNRIYNNLRSATTVEEAREVNPDHLVNDLDYYCRGFEVEWEEERHSEEEDSIRGDEDENILDQRRRRQGQD